MKIIDAGHKYVLESLDGDLQQVLTFVKRDGNKFPFNRGSYTGTNCQEVLRALIDRAEYLYKQEQSAETELIIANLKNVLFLFEVRAARKHNRLLDLVSAQELINGQPCKKCGHIGCNQH